MPAEQTSDQVLYQWWEPLLEWDGGAWYVAGSLIALLLILWLVRGLYRLKKMNQAANKRDKILPTEGSISLEFVLVFPILLFLVLTLLQLVFLMTGNLYVHYAAFAAARTAVVHIPLNVSGGEAPNRIVTTNGFEKYDAIHQSAILAMVPVCGQCDSMPSEVELDTERYLEGVAEYYLLMDQPEPKWIETLLAGQLNYAARNTEIIVMSLPEDSAVDGPYSGFERVTGMHEYGPSDPVGVTVVHNFHLGVPYVRALFADGKLGSCSGYGSYARIEGHAILTNEGANKQLPPSPTLIRREGWNYLWPYLAR